MEPPMPYRFARLVPLPLLSVALAGAAAAQRARPEGGPPAMDGLWSVSVSATVHNSDGTDVRTRAATLVPFDDTGGGGVDVAPIPIGGCLLFPSSAGTRFLQAFSISNGEGRIAGSLRVDP